MGWLKLCTQNSKVLCRPCLRRVGESALVRSLTALVDMIKLIHRDLLIRHHQCPSFNASYSRIDPKCGSDPVLCNFLCRSITISERHVPCGRIIPQGQTLHFLLCQMTVFKEHGSHIEIHFGGFECPVIRADYHHYPVLRRSVISGSYPISPPIPVSSWSLITVNLLPVKQPLLLCTLTQYVAFCVFVLD